MALLPDERVISFGTDQTGAQGAQMVYDLSGWGAQDDSRHLLLVFL
jgi:hypothetical protein